VVSDNLIVHEKPLLACYIYEVSKTALTR